MARINIEDSLYKDGRFTKLCIKLGSKWAALGALVEAWTLAQEFVNIDNPEGLTPIADWKKREICDVILEVNLAEIRGDLVCLSGAQEQFAWLVQAMINGNKGGRPKNRVVTEPEPAGNPRVKPRNPLTLSPSSSSKKKLNSSSFRAGAGPEEIAAQCFLAIKRFGPDDGDELRKFVGDEVYERVRKTIGWQAVREMKRDQFATMNLIRGLGSA